MNDIDFTTYVWTAWYGKVSGKAAPKRYRKPPAKPKKKPSSKVANIRVRVLEVWSKKK